MNLLIVSGMYPPIRTGSAFYARNLAHALAGRGHRVRVVALEARSGDDRDLEVKVLRLPALRVPLPGFFKHFQVSALFPSNYRALVRNAREFGAHAVLLVNHYLDIAFPAIYTARRLRIPLLCSVGTQLQSLNPARDRLLNGMDRLVCGHWVFPYCDRVIAWDTQILQYLSDVHGRRVTDKTVIVNYGVNGDPERFLRHHHDYGLHNQILGVGAVSEQRSFVPLVRAFRLLAGEFPALCLKIVGHVYYDEAVRLTHDLRLADRVVFAGEMAHEQVLEEMGRSDALYSSLTSKYLGLGTATIESMLMGLPTVANTPLDLLGGPLLEDGTHLIHCPGTADREIADRLRALLSDSALRERVGQGGRRFIQQHMNWDKVARDMEAAIAPLARGHAA